MKASAFIADKIMSCFSFMEEEPEAKKSPWAVNDTITLTNFHIFDAFMSIWPLLQSLLPGHDLTSEQGKGKSQAKIITTYVLLNDSDKDITVGGIIKANLSGK